MPIEIRPAFGWDKCLSLSNEQAELIISLEVGPRILSYRLKDGQNVLHPVPGDMGGRGEGEFKVRGGHRLWVAPEDARSYALDNQEVIWSSPSPETVLVSNEASAPWWISKSMQITLQPNSSAVEIHHRITNGTDQPIEVAAWALTVMAPGGLELIPQPPLGIHGQGAPGREFLPTRVLVPWPFTDLSDPRWHLGQRFITLRTEAGRPATKLGLPHREGWVGYALPNAFFVKTFAHLEGVPYPDFGCNFETFTEDLFLEIESLSPLQRLEPGQSIAHRESWHLLGGIPAPDSLEDSALGQWVAPLIEHLAL